MAGIGSTDLDVFPLALGGNVFGWTADEKESFAVLDAFRAGGGNWIDTADGYSAWVPGNHGGESETVIGDWIASRGTRDDVVLTTKISQHPDFRGLSRATVHGAVDASLGRLRTDVIDILLAHYDDRDTPLEETVAAFGELVEAGKVRYVGLSNYTPERVEAAIAIAREAGSAPFVVVQPQYNLVEREPYESALAPIVEREGLTVMPYYALAMGFLTGKYRDPADGGSPRAQGALKYLDERGRRVLAALDAAAAAHQESVATVSLAWLRSRPGVVAPLASARTPEQVPDLLASATLELTPAELESLDEASASAVD